jgi:hypothetical protein
VSPQWVAPSFLAFRSPAHAADLTARAYATKAGASVAGQARAIRTPLMQVARRRSDGSRHYP